MKSAAGKPGHIAKWDGKAWSTLTPDIGPATIQCIAISGKGELYIGGAFRKVDGAAVDAVAKWNEQSWVALDKPVPAQVTSILFDKAGAMYAGGTFYRKDNGGGPGNFVAKWNGTQWSPLETITARPLSPTPPKASETKSKKK